MQPQELLGIHYPPQDVIKKRAKVRQTLLSKSPYIGSGVITRMAVSDLEMLFQYYDEIFLNCYFQSYFPGKLHFALSRRMTRNAGKTNYPRNLKELRPEQENYEIRIGIDFFFNYGRLQRDKIVNGINTADALDALLLVFEHELVHLIELHCCKESSCRRERFKTLAKQLFGHNDVYHQLPTGGEIAGARYGLGIGDQVFFSHEGKGYEGVVYRINKRATIMVPDAKGPFQDRQDQRYSKWYVPLDALEKK